MPPQAAGAAAQARAAENDIKQLTVLQLKSMANAHRDLRGQVNGAIKRHQLERLAIEAHGRGTPIPNRPSSSPAPIRPAPAAPARPSASPAPVRPAPAAPAIRPRGGQPQQTISASAVLDSGWLYITLALFALVYHLVSRATACGCSSKSTLVQRYVGSLMCGSFRNSMQCTISCALAGHFDSNGWWSCCTLERFLKDWPLYLIVVPIAFYAYGLVRRLGTRYYTRNWSAHDFVNGLGQKLASISWQDVYDALLMLTLIFQLGYWIIRCVRSMYDPRRYLD